MNTPDLITCALFGSTLAGSLGWAAWSCHGSAKDAAATTAVLAWSAAQRAEQAPTEDGTPPGGREPAPQAEPAPARLATVHQLPTRHAA